MAAVDMFLKLDGVDGESQDHKHKGEIHIESFSFGAHQMGTGHAGGGSGAGKVVITDINVTKLVDKASPKLFLYCANGKHIPSGLLTVRKAGETPVEYLKIKLTDVLVSSFQDAGHGNALVPESLTLNFSKIEYAYQEQGADGKPTGSPQTMGWDVKANKKL